ncbi:MAG TPA: hypothetical protein DEO85_09900 [Maritimibacter sp.]|nr:hypothetical protein [Maritimibacter sp.]
MNVPHVLRGAGLLASLASFFVFAYLLFTAVTSGLGASGVPVLLVTAVTLFVLGEVLRWRSGAMVGAGPLDDNDPLTDGTAKHTGIPRPTDEALHEAVYNDAFRKQQKHGDGGLIEAERLTLHLVPLHIYVSSNGLRNGIAGFGLSETKASLPYFVEIGLEDVATVLEAYLAKDEGPASDPQTAQDALTAAGFNDIPARVDAYLDTRYPWGAEGATEH